MKYGLFLMPLHPPERMPADAYDYDLESVGWALPASAAGIYQSVSCCSVSLNQTTGDSYTHAPELSYSSVRHAHENGGGQGRRAHSARYARCANVVWFDLGCRGQERSSNKEVSHGSESGH